MTQIQSYLENVHFSDLKEQLNLFDCHVSLRHGRKFSLAGYEGELSLNQLICSVYQSALQYAGKIEGEKIVQQLWDLHQKGETELNTNPWWVRWITLLKRVFTFWKRSHHIKQLQDFSGGYLNGYVIRKGDELLKPITSRGYTITPEDIKMSSLDEISNGVLTSRKVTCAIKIPQSSNESKISITIDESKTLEEHFQEVLVAVEQSLPFWLDSQEEMNLLTGDLKEHINQLLSDWRSEERREIDCELDDLEMLVETEVSASAYLICSCKVKFLKFTNHGEHHRQFQLKKVILANPNNDSYILLKKEWLASIDQKIENFLKKSIESEPTFSSSDEELFAKLFGDDFFSFFGSASFTSSGKTTEQQMSDHLTTLETLLEEPANLVSLLNEKKYSELEEAIRKLWKKGARKLHPDKASGKGLSSDEVEKITEKFKRFGEAYFYALDWLSKR